MTNAVPVLAPPQDQSMWSSGRATVSVARKPLVRMVDRLRDDAAAEHAALCAGLLAPQASIPPKYFYDPLGCALFGAICALPEYYPTRTEAAIFDAHRAQIAGVLGSGKQFVDLGAGDCAKSRAWLPHVAASRFIAVDIAGDTMATALAAIAADHPALECVGVVTDFTRGLDLAGELGPGAATFFYPGSSIGNFAPDEARAFLSAIAAQCATRAGSGLLIGVDLHKDAARLTAAYDDATGVTAAFNRNVLNHVNAVLGSDFNPRDFAHRALYDERLGRIEMHLEAMAPVRVALAGQARTFAIGERIHTENSYKYTPAVFTRLLQAAGFGQVQYWQDAARDFAVFHAR